MPNSDQLLLNLGTAIPDCALASSMTPQQTKGYLLTLLQEFLRLGDGDHLLIVVLCKTHSCIIISIVKTVPSQMKALNAPIVWLLALAVS